MRRVAHHQRAPRLDAGDVHAASRSMSGCGFANPSSAQRVASNHGRSPVASSTRSSPRRAFPVATARRRPRPCRSASISRTPAIERRLVLVGEEVVAVALGESPLPFRVEARRHVAERIGGAQADHEPRVALGRHGDSDIAACALQAPRRSAASSPSACRPSRRHEVVSGERTSSVLGSTSDAAVHRTRLQVGGQRRFELRFSSPRSRDARSRASPRAGTSA